jgi:hypothetical protein
VGLAERNIKTAISFAAAATSFLFVWLRYVRHWITTMAPLHQLSAASADTSIFMSSPYDDFVMEHETHIIDFGDSQTLAVMGVSLSFAAVSVSAALFAFYWFVRMRRGFRQE